MKKNDHAWPRRRFLATLAAGVAGAGCLPEVFATGKNVRVLDLKPEIFSLLRDWTDALISLQYVEPTKPELHGAFRCPACNHLHGRAGDAVYPLLAMAQRTGESKHFEAAKRAAAWMKNVDSSDGAWTNEVDPKSWKGTTVFAAIALGKSLQKYGSLLDLETREQWASRLRKAGGFIRKNLDFDYANINYPLTASYALALLGRMLDTPEWRIRARELARQGITYLTEPHGLIYGEGTPITKISPLGCRPVDLGYNVEESLPALLEYARLESDAVVETAVRRSFRAHLEFLLPDGGWDNSWGTRSFKWTYWGSRTSDGCLAALLELAKHDPVYWTAAQRQLQLFRACTHDGLLYGGPHLQGSSLPPCVHHTFAHAKALADALELDATLKTTPPQLPRAAAHGIKHHSEIATWLAASGGWRATVTGYDWFYHGKVRHPTGGALAMLWHEKTGPIFAGSLAKYELVEEFNQQPAPPGKDFPLTPRIEETIDAKTYSSLYDSTATVQATDAGGHLKFVVQNQTTDADGRKSGGQFEVEYLITPDECSITARRLIPGKAGSSAVLIFPVVSEWTEKLTRFNDATTIIKKPLASLRISANQSLRLAGDQERVFNLVPGFAAVPFMVVLDGTQTVQCRFSINS